MKKNKTELKTNPFVSTLTILFGIIAVILVLTLLVDSLFPSPGTRMGLRMNFQVFAGLLLLNVFITTINSILLAFLLYTYVSVYRQVKSTFSLGLIVTAGALFAHSLTSNPLLQVFFGFRGSGLGPFTIIPSLFTLVAAGVLIYLSRK